MGVKTYMPSNRPPKPRDRVPEWAVECWHDGVMVKTVTAAGELERAFEVAVEQIGAIVRTGTTLFPPGSWRFQCGAHERRVNLRRSNR